MNNKILLIVPCYNEELRLNKSEFMNSKFSNIDFLFADDGSTDGTKNILKDMEKESDKIQCFIAEKNLGKAAVIRNAYLFAKDKNILSSYDWVGFWDADLATPIYEASNMLTYVNSFYASENIDAVFGSRVLRLGADIKRNPKRHYLGRCFATLVSFILNVKPYDTQCGAKLFKTSVLDTAFQETFISTWVFDVEILLRLISANKKVTEYSLAKWEDIEGSKLNVVKELPRVLKDLYKIWKHYDQ